MLTKYRAAALTLLLLAAIYAVNLELSNRSAIQQPSARRLDDEHDAIKTDIRLLNGRYYVADLEENGCGKYTENSEYVVIMEESMCREVFDEYMKKHAPKDVCDRTDIKSCEFRVVSNDALMPGCMVQSPGAVFVWNTYAGSPTYTHPNLAPVCMRGDTPAPTMEPTPAPTEPLDVYHVMIKGGEDDAGYCLETMDRFEPKSAIRIGRCTDDNQNQHWEYDPKSGLIRSYDGQRPGLCLALKSARKGGKVHTKPCDAKNKKQRWSYDRDSMKIKAKKGGGSRYCLAMEDRWEPRSPVIMMPCKGQNDHLKWRFMDRRFDY